jgi:hypothetical protein
MSRPRHFDRRLVQQFLIRQNPRNPIDGFDDKVWGCLPPPNLRKKRWRRKKANHKSPISPNQTDSDNSDNLNWDDNCVPLGDLISFLSRHEDDVLSRWIAERASNYFSSCMPTIKEIGIVGFKYRGILRLTVSIATIVASILPCISIVVLYSLKSTWVRLLALSGFNVLIAICLTTMTNAKPSDVFAISAA